MAIRYVRAPDVEERVRRIAELLRLDHIDHRVICVRAEGSAARWTLARCHALPKIFQAALGVEACYIIEVIPGEFDALSEEDKTKTLIHELLHIPKAFGGGLKSHRFVNRRTVDRLYETLLRRSEQAAERESGIAFR